MKFTQNAIVQNGKKVTVIYCVGDKKVTIYEDRYGNFRDLEGISYENNSDSQTDYFERSRIYLNEGDQYYEEARKAGLAKEESREKARNKIKLQKAMALEQAEKTLMVNGRNYIVLNEKPNETYPELTQYELKKPGRSKKVYVYSTNGKSYIRLYAKFANLNF